ncbi:unnamed protein product [Cyclocybe aegerita]|uniref:Uncharacterized protein n=1 Tax=Cyclocybe aegerita TaxID=1973307 RepID=A0A8S0WZF0_CYCAE|nr:unnamed protein product [Cyclocybe aegerita]
MTAGRLQVRIVDDRDPDIILSASSSSQSSQDWNRNSSGSKNEFMYTTSFTQTGGATVTHSFVGSFIAVYGTVSGDPRTTKPKSRCSIDGGQHSVFEASESGYHIKFYESPVLPAGHHTLVIENMLEGGHLWLDYLVVISIDTNVPPPLDGPDSPSRSSHPSSPTSCGHGATTSSDPRVLGIVSGILGLIIFIGVVVTIAIVIRKRAKKRNHPTDQGMLKDWSSGRRFLSTEHDKMSFGDESRYGITNTANDTGTERRSSLDDLSILSASTTLRSNITIDENRLKQLLELDRVSTGPSMPIIRDHKSSPGNPSDGRV